MQQNPRRMAKVCLLQGDSTFITEPPLTPTAAFNKKGGLQQMQQMQQMQSKNVFKSDITSIPQPLLGYAILPSDRAK
jgi:hypothetical protein